MSAQPPAIPTTVIKNLFLYRNIFLAVTFPENDRCFHIIPICSSKIFLPFFGDFGLISVDGTSESSLIHAASVAATITAAIDAIAIIERII